MSERFKDINEFLNFRRPDPGATVDAKLNENNELICPYCQNNFGDKEEFIKNTEPAGIGICADGIVKSYICFRCGGPFMNPDEKAVKGKGE